MIDNTMKTLVVFALLGAVALASDLDLTGNDGADDRIIGGVVSSVTAHPYLTGIVINYVNVAGSYACGGSLLNNQRVLTAAHCYRSTVNVASKMTVVMGSEFLFFGGTQMDVTGVAVHPNYVPATLENDIAVLYLPSTVTFSTTIQPIQLPAAESAATDFTGINAVASGYGMYSDSIPVSTSTVARQVMLQVISEAQCRAAFPATVTSTNLCTSGGVVGNIVGICHGDSGGPLAVDVGGMQVLIGVSSFVSSSGCELGFPSGFAKVSSFVPWIQQHL